MSVVLRFFSFLCLLGILGCHLLKGRVFAAENFSSAQVMPAQVIDTPKGVLERDISEGFKQLLEAAIVNEAKERDIFFGVMISAGSEKLLADYEAGDLRAQVVLIPKVSFEYEERSVTERYFGQEVQRRVTFIKSARLDLQVQQNISDPMEEEEGQYMLLFSLQKRESVGHRLDEASYAGISLALSSLASDAAKETFNRLFPELKEENQPRSRK